MNAIEAIATAALTALLLSPPEAGQAGTPAATLPETSLAGSRLQKSLATGPEATQRTAPNGVEQVGQQ